MFESNQSKFHYTKENHFYLTIQQQENERFLKEANEYIDCIHKNGSDFNCDEVSTLLNMQKNEVLKNFKDKKIPSLFNAEIKYYLDFIYVNCNQENVTDTLDLLFMIMDEIEEKMKASLSENKTDIMNYRNNVVDMIGNLIMFPIFNRKISVYEEEGDKIS